MSSVTAVDRLWALTTSLTPPRSVLAILATAAFITCFDNDALWYEISRLTLGAEYRWAVSIAFFVILLGTLNVFLAVSAFRRSLKPVLILLLMLAAAIGFLMSEHEPLLAASAVAGVLHTDSRELHDLLTLSLVRHVGFFGAAPSILVALVPLDRAGWGKEIAYRVGLVTASLAVLVLVVHLCYRDLSVFTQRNHHVRTLINPGYPIYALVKNLRRTSPSADECGAFDAPPGVARGGCVGSPTS